jgi:hypothetical protein
LAKSARPTLSVSRRPASAAFAREQYSPRLGLRTYRPVHGDCPTVTPSHLGFHHLGRCLRCERGGKFNNRRIGYPSSDDPQFLDGVAKELSGLLHGPHCQRFVFCSRD